MTDRIPDIALFVTGLVLLLASAELLVRKVVVLASLIKTSGMFIGLTITALGTSAPELAVGIAGRLSGNGDVGLGNIVGSNIFNIFFVLGLAAIVQPILVRHRTVKRDIPILLLTCGLFYLMVLDGSMGTIESIVLVAVLSGYLYYASRVSHPDDQPVHGKPLASGQAVPRQRVMVLLGLTALSITAMMFASSWMVTGATGLADSLGMSTFLIGLTIVAVGTSLPEIATTVAAIRQSQYDLAVGNVIGSCFFNIVAVPATMTLVSASALPVADEAIAVDIPVMMLAIVACLPIFLSDQRVSRIEGTLFLAYYFAYALLLYFRNSPESILSPYKTELSLLAGPVIAITIAILLVRTLKHRKQRHEGARS